MYTNDKYRDELMELNTMVKIMQQKISRQITEIDKLKEENGRLRAENEIERNRTPIERNEKLQEENEQLQQMVENLKYDLKYQLEYLVDVGIEKEEKYKEALRKCIPFTACSNKANNVCEFCYEKEHTEDCEYVRLCGNDINVATKDGGAE